MPERKALDVRDPRIRASIDRYWRSNLRIMAVLLVPLWYLGIKAQGIGVVGMLLDFAVALGLTPLCRGPSAATRDMIEGIREPEGVGPAIDIEATPEH